MPQIFGFLNVDQLQDIKYDIYNQDDPLCTLSWRKWKIV